MRAPHKKIKKKMFCKTNVTVIPIVMGTLGLFQSFGNNYRMRNQNQPDKKNKKCDVPSGGRFIRFSTSSLSSQFVNCFDCCLEDNGVTLRCLRDFEIQSRPSPTQVLRPQSTILFKPFLREGR